MSPKIREKDAPKTMFPELCVRFLNSSTRIKLRSPIGLSGQTG